jgi:tRNA A22 N-methylase
VKRGRARREAILELARPFVRGLVVDVGCDHGHTTAALQDLGTASLVVGTERLSSRLPRRGDLHLLVTDGLAGFEVVQLAVITGMGPHAILGVLERGPRPAAAVLHSPDRTDTLRRGLKAQGWRVDAEKLAPEGRGFAEVIRVLPGEETAEGLALDFGPGLLGDALLQQHVEHLLRHWTRIAEVAPLGSRGRARAEAWIPFLRALQG